MAGRVNVQVEMSQELAEIARGMDMSARAFVYRLMDLCEVSVVVQDLMRASRGNVVDMREARTRQRQAAKAGTVEPESSAAPPVTARKTARPTIPPPVPVDDLSPAEQTERRASEARTDEAHRLDAIGRAAYVTVLQAGPQNEESAAALRKRAEVAGIRARLAASQRPAAEPEPAEDVEL